MRYCHKIATLQWLYTIVLGNSDMSVTFLYNYAKCNDVDWLYAIFKFIDKNPIRVRCATIYPI